MIATQHWKKLSEVCDDVQMYEKERKVMHHYGARSANKKYLKVMSLDQWEEGEVLPAYRYYILSISNSSSFSI